MKPDPGRTGPGMADCGEYGAPACAFALFYGSAVKFKSIFYRATAYTCRQSEALHDETRLPCLCRISCSRWRSPCRLSRCWPGTRRSCRVVRRRGVAASGISIRRRRTPDAAGRWSNVLLRRWCRVHPAFAFPPRDRIGHRPDSDIRRQPCAGGAREAPRAARHRRAPDGRGGSSADSRSSVLVAARGACGTSGGFGAGSRAASGPRLILAPVGAAEAGVALLRAVARPQPEIARLRDGDRPCFALRRRRSRPQLG